MNYSWTEDYARRFLRSIPDEIIGRLLWETVRNGPVSNSHKEKADAMKAIVVYESLWGNTAAVARAIAEGLGSGAKALSTAEANTAALAGVDIIVAGAPVLGFSVPSDRMIQTIEAGKVRENVPPDTSQPSMRSWLDALAAGRGRSAAFETRIWWSPGGSTGGIERGLESKGYSPLAKPRRFIVKGKYGPLREGEIEKARAWGADLAQAMKV
jgi:hypothetical protein